MKKILFISILLIIAIITNCSSNIGKDISEQYEYDSEGRLIEKIAPDGGKTGFKYNEQGLLKKIIYPKGSVSYAYDVIGNRIWMQDEHGKTEYKYDAFDRLTEVIFRYSPEKRIKYEYDPWSRISSISITGKNGADYQVKYEYNILGNLVSIDDGIERIDYTYYPDRGELVRHLPNGIKTTYSYSPLGELTILKHFDPQNMLIASYRYVYNSTGKISHVIEKAPGGIKTTKYEWDNRGYIKVLHYPDGNIIRYEYDAMGNRLSMTNSMGTINYNYDNFGRLIKAGNTRYEWSINGNLISRIEIKSKTRIRYDGRGLPTLIRAPDATIRYQWDGDGNMISKRIGKDITYYLPNPLAPHGFTLVEFDKTGKFTASYLYGDGLLGQLGIKGQMKYFLEDGFNSIRHILDMNGNIVGQRDYTPFGEPIITKDDRSINFRVAGERFLPEIKTFLVGRRLYKPETGRYLTSTHNRLTPSAFIEPRFNQRLKVPSVFPKLNSTYTPIGYRLKDYNDPVFRRARELVELGQRLPLPPKNVIEQHDRYWIEGRYLDTDPYYQDLKNLDQVAPLTPDNYFRAFGLAIGAVGSNLARGLLGGWEGAVQEGINLFIPFTPLGKKALNVVQTAKNLFDPWKYVGEKLLGGMEQNFRRKYKEFTGVSFGEEDLNDERKYKPPDCPGCDGGDPPGGLFGRGGSGLGGGSFFSDPLKSIEANLGGIKLDATAQFTGNLGDIIGAVYNAEKQYLVLVGDGVVSLPSIKPEDLAVALMSVLGPYSGDIAFSLDPYDPINPKGKWLKAVYIPEQIIGGTEFGKTLFEADWLLKQYAFGVAIDEQGRMHERKSFVSGFKSTKDLMFELKGQTSEQERWARYWIVSDDMRLKQSGNSIYFETAKMRVKAKRQVPDPSSPTGLRDVDADDPISTKFANGFTELYDEIAKESPEFERLKQLAKAVAIAKWIKQEGIPFDTSWVNEYANKRIDTADRIAALSTQWEKKEEIPFQKGNKVGIQTIIRRLHLFGGVDLTVKPKYISDDGTAQRLKKSITSKLREKGIGPVFNIDSKGKTLRAVVLPITRKGQEMWRIWPTTTDEDGTTYQFNNEGTVTKSTDRFGNITKYRYDPNQKLMSIKLKTKKGWKAFAEKNDWGTLWTITDPKREVIQYRYGKSGYLSEIEFEGNKIITLDYLPKRGITKIQYEGYDEKISYDNDGYIREYEVRRKTKLGEVKSEAERIYLEYDALGNITQIEGTLVGKIDIVYSIDKLPTIIKTPREQIRYAYDSKKRVKEVFFSSGLSANYIYDEQKLAKIELKKGDRRAENIFDKGRIVKARNFLGGLTEYRYNERGLLSSVIDPERNTRKYAYDENNRLREIHFPDGHWIEYRYGERKSPAAKRRSIEGQSIITVIYHSSSSPLREITPRKSKSIEHTKDVLKKRLKDDLRASKYLKNGLIIDLFSEGKGMTHTNIVDSSGKVKEISSDIAKELSWLLNRTARTRGKLGRTLLERWDRFYNDHLRQLVKPRYWLSPHDKKLKLKPILIIKYNEVNYKYANLERVPVLKDNFIIFIASKNREGKDVAETSAEALVTKINHIPGLSKENVLFAIRLPRMKKEMHKEWEETITELERLVGRENILFNPSKQEFTRMLNNRKKEIIVIELTHTDKGITLKGNERFNTRDVFLGGDLSHIKYLIAGLGTCSLPRLENGKLAAAFRKKGVGIMNGSFGSVSTEIALKRLKKLIDLFESCDEYDFPAYYLPDIIDQLIDVPRKEKGTTNLGKLDFHKRRFFS